VAEKLIAKVSRAGLPVITYRLGLILADTETGTCNRNDFYTLLIAAIMKIKCYPTEAIKAIITGVPANIAARNIVDLSQNKTNAYGNIYTKLSTNKMYYHLKVYSSVNFYQTIHSKYLINCHRIS